jgi:hypothetical protein
MPRFMPVFALAALGLVAFGPTVALAVSPSEQQCTASGGTFTKENGTVICTTSSTSNVGNSPNSQTTTTSTETTGQGNTGNKTTNTSTCSGPGNSGSSSAHC